MVLDLDASLRMLSLIHRDMYMYLSVFPHRMHCFSPSSSRPKEEACDGRLAVIDNLQAIQPI